MNIKLESNIPVLETDRLRLRAHQLKDFGAMAAMWADADVTRYTIGTPSTDQRTWLRMLTYLGHWSLLGYGYWAVAEKNSDHYIGEVGYADFKREISHPLSALPELGWALAPHKHGMGYATEALQAVVAWGDKNLDAAKSICLIYPDNVASLRVAAKLEFVEADRLMKNGDVEILFSRTQRASR